MAFRLADHVIRGEIINTTYYSTHGWLEFRDNDRPFSLQLTGNCSPDLAGWHFRFEVENPLQAAVSDPPDLAWQQIGPTGTMTADHQIRVFDCSHEEYLRRCELGEPPPTEWKRCLYLEWYGQNGRVVLELPGAVLEFVKFEAWPEGQNACQKTTAESYPIIDPEDADGESGADQNVAPPFEDFPSLNNGLNITEITQNADGHLEVTEEVFGPIDDDSDLPFYDLGEDEEEKDDDPYQLFPDSLQKQLDTEAYHTEWKIQGESDDGEKSESIRELELMDYLIENSDGEEFDSFCHLPVPLEKIEFLSDDQVETALKDILGQLALCGVALDFCEHYTPRRAYRLLVEEILREQRFYPQLRGTGWVQHFSTYEFCAECDAKFDKEFEEYERKRNGSQTISEASDIGEEEAGDDAK